MGRLLMLSYGYIDVVVLRSFRDISRDQGKLSTLINRKINIRFVTR